MQSSVSLEESSSDFESPANRFVVPKVVIVSSADCSSDYTAAETASASSSENSDSNFIYPDDEKKDDHGGAMDVREDVVNKCMHRLSLMKSLKLTMSKQAQQKMCSKMGANRAERASAMFLTDFISQQHQNANRQPLQNNHNDSESDHVLEVSRRSSTISRNSRSGDEDDSELKEKQETESSTDEYWAKPPPMDQRDDGWAKPPPKHPRMKKRISLAIMRKVSLLKTTWTGKLRPSV